MANLGNPQETIAVLQRYGFNFQKKYGQNFLIDTHVLDKIIGAEMCIRDRPSGESSNLPALNGDSEFS